MIRLTYEECHCGLVALYSNIARRMGYDPTAVVFDCRKIDVSTGVHKAFKEFIVDSGDDVVAANTLWLFAGPKASIESNELLADPHEGFIIPK